MPSKTKLIFDERTGKMTVKWDHKYKSSKPSKPVITPADLVAYRREYFPTLTVIGKDGRRETGNAE
jgi:hypothetical protein